MNNRWPSIMSDAMMEELLADLIMDAGEVDEIPSELDESAVRDAAVNLATPAGDALSAALRDVVVRAPQAPTRVKPIKVILFRAAAAASRVGPLLVHPIALGRKSPRSLPIHGVLEVTPEGDRIWTSVSFHNEPTEFARGNDRSLLQQYEDSHVCIEFQWDSQKACTTLRLGTKDANGTHLTSDRQCLSPRGSLDAVTAITVSEVEPDYPADEVLVGFPLIGEWVFPDFEKFTAPEEFSHAVGLHTPDVLFHLAIRATAQASFSSFRVLSAERIRSYYDSLLLGKLPSHVSTPAGFAVEPREYVFGHLPAPGECSPYAFSLPSRPDGNSYDLAVLVGMVAATVRRPIPPWALFSSLVRQRSLDLTYTGELERKIKLAIGDEPARTHHEKWLNELYGHDATKTDLGPQSRRCVPGGVKLFIASTTTDFAPGSLRSPFSAEPIPNLTVRDFEHRSFDELRERIEEIGEGSMLLVQASNAFQVLHLLGFHHWHPEISNELLPPRREPAALPLQVTRIRKSASRCIPSAVTVRGRLKSREFWENAAQESLAALDERLAGVENIFDRLRLVLDSSIEAINMLLEDAAGRSPARPGCFSGDISIVCSETKWLRAVAVAGTGITSMPYYVPADIGITGRAIRTGRTAIVRDTTVDPDFKCAISPVSPVVQRYSYDTCLAYQEFLRTIKSCIKVPLKRGRDTLGVLCIHCDTPRDFDPDLVWVLETLAERATLEAVYLLGTEAPLTDSVSELHTPRLPDVGRDETLRTLSSRLASFVMSRTGAYRVAVRLLRGERDGMGLQVIGAAGVWPAEFLEHRTSLTENGAATHAIRIGRSYHIQDTSQAYTSEDGCWLPVHYRRIAPAAQAHSSVLLRVGGHLLGVASVDWPVKGINDARVQQLLEDLAAEYADAMKALGAESLTTIEAREMKDLDFNQLLQSPSLEEPDYSSFLASVAEMVGAGQGAIFIRRPSTGLFHLAASLHHSVNDPVWSGDNNWYEPGQGVTGWVLKRNRPLRLCNLRDHVELARIDPEDPPVWLDKIYDGVFRNDRNWTYLGIPVSVGHEVIGVIRLANRMLDIGFTSYDQAIVMAAASRLAGVLYERDQTRRMEAYTRFASAAAMSRTPSELSTAIFQCLEEGIGPCTSWFRCLNGDVLVSVAVSNSNWRDKTALERLKGTGFAGRVFETGEMLVIQDVRKEPRAREMVEDDPSYNRELVETFRSLVCVPIFAATGNAVGTLLICRVNPWAFSVAELTFIREIVRLSGSMLGTMAFNR